MCFLFIILITLVSKYELNETWVLALYFSGHLRQGCHRSSRYGSCPAEPIFYSSLWSLSDSRASLSALGAFGLPLLSFLISRNDLLLLPHYFSVHLRSQHIGKVTARRLNTGSVQSEVQGETRDACFNIPAPNGGRVMDPPPQVIGALFTRPNKHIFLRHH